MLVMPLVVHARRFFCDAQERPRHIFVEPFPGCLARYARQTERWWQALLELAHASGLEMAARIAGLLECRASPDTLIRRQRAERFALASPRLLEVDKRSEAGWLYGVQYMPWAFPAHDEWCPPGW